MEQASRPIIGISHGDINDIGLVGGIPTPLKSISQTYNIGYIYTLINGDLMMVNDDQ